VHGTQGRPASCPGTADARDAWAAAGCAPPPGRPPPPSFPHQAQSGLWHLHRARSRDAAGWLTPALAVAQGLSCDGGQLYTWGANAKGQLGHGDKCPGAIDAPVQVQALADSEVK